MNIRALYRIIERHDPNQDYLWYIDWDEKDGLVMEITLNVNDMKHIAKLQLDSLYTFRYKIKETLQLMEKLAKVSNKD